MYISKTGKINQENSSLSLFLSLIRRVLKTTHKIS